MDIDRSTTALLLMDLQRDIVAEDGKFGSQGMGAAVTASGVIPANARALAAAREAGLPVLHIGVEQRPGLVMNLSAGLFAGVVESGALMAGTPGAEFMPDVAPLDDEYVAMKGAVSGFAGTDLEAQLRNIGVRDLVLGGVATNFVIEGTARQAVDAGYRVTILRDACCSFTPEMHEFALTVLENLASIATVDDFVAALA